MSKIATFTGILALAIGVGLTAAQAGSIVIQQSGPSSTSTVQNNTRGAYELLKGIFNDLDMMGNEDLSDDAAAAAAEAAKTAGAPDAIVLPDDTTTVVEQDTFGTTIVKRRDTNGNTATVIQSE